MIHKKLLSLLVLLMTAASGAWATVYNSGEVNSAVLKVGDILYDVTIGNYFKLAANRYKYQNVVQNVNSYPLVTIDVGNTGTIMYDYKPFTADGQDGNAWVVVEKMSVSPNSGEVQVLLGGIIYDPNSIYPDTDAETEGAAFTTASFTMPASDATVKYVMARDLREDVEFSGLPTKFLLRKGDGSKYQFDDPSAFSTYQLLDKLDANNVKDITTSTDITHMVGKMVELQELPGSYRYDETTEVSLAEFLADDLVPGKYAIRAVASDDGEYYGYCSAPLDLVEGYPVEVPAGEYVTYYSDENLTVDAESGAVLYTITNVSGNTATATLIPSANAGMPFLIFNSTDEPQTFYLLPTTAQIDLLVYPGFKGTLEGKTFTAAEMAATDHYVVNKAKFVWVKDPGTIAAHRCWLELTKNSAARSLNIVFGDATAIGAVSGSPTDNGDIYDLNGRKVQKPVKKGVYIQNGQKKIVK